MSAELDHEIEIDPSFVASMISEVTAWIAFKFQLWLPLGHILRRFLALLDYVSRAHEIAICPSSVVRP